MLQFRSLGGKPLLAGRGHAQPPRVRIERGLHELAMGLGRAERSFRESHAQASGSADRFRPPLGRALREVLGRLDPVASTLQIAARLLDLQISVGDERAADVRSQRR